VAVLAAEPGILGLVYLIERLAEMAHDMELVEQDRRLRRGRYGGVAKRLPRTCPERSRRVHDGEADLPAFLWAQLGVELRHAGLRAILATKPDRPPGEQVADDDAIGVALADRDLVDPDRHG